MDSANSGSLQSSSGGDDDFDSLSALFRSSSSSSSVAPSGAAAAMQLLSSSSNHHHLFDSRYLDPSSLLPFDTTASASPTATVSWPPAGGGPTKPVQPREASAAIAATASTQRSSKKRSRASRRTPTTVLATDTANFRAMVQEFTGIPSAPFARTSRFDAFLSPAGAAFRSFGAGAAAGEPSYLLRPLAQKLQTPASFTATSSAASMSSMSIANTNASTPIATSTTSSGTYPTGAANNYQLHDLLLGSSNQSLLNSHSPVLSFQSPPQPHLHGKHAEHLPQTMPSTSAEYGGFVQGSEASPEVIGLRSSWTASTPAPIASDQVQLRSISGDSLRLRQQRTSGCKMNLSALGSSSEVDAEKVAETARASRGEGTFESWICSSD